MRATHRASLFARALASLPKSTALQWHGSKYDHSCQSETLRYYHRDAIYPVHRCRLIVKLGRVFALACRACLRLQNQQSDGQRTYRSSPIKAHHAWRPRKNHVCKHGISDEGPEASSKSGTARSTGPQEGEKGGQTVELPWAANDGARLRHRRANERQRTAPRDAAPVARARPTHESSSDERLRQ